MRQASAGRTGSRGQAGAAAGQSRREAVITIAELGEFGLIAAIAERLPGGPDLILGAGDDAAVLRAPDGRVVATTDMLIEGRHFRRDWSAAADIGRRAAARNLADVAAMGARPTGLLVAMALPGDLPVDWALAVVDGIAGECARVGAAVAGGDISGADLVMLAVTALGDLAGSPPVTRAGARAGDVVAATGTLGSAAAGLALLEAVRAGRAGPVLLDCPDLAGLLGAYRAPDPPYLAVPQAAQAGATALIDISDGLIADLAHLAGASGVSLDISADRAAAAPLARPAALRAAAAAIGAPDWLSWVLAGGDDHALAATFPPDHAVPPGWTVIGSARPGSGVTVDGRTWAASGGWEHFPR